MSALLDKFGKYVLLSKAANQGVKKGQKSVNSSLWNAPILNDILLLIVALCNELEDPTFMIDTFLWLIVIVVVDK